MKKLLNLILLLPAISFATVSNGPYVGLEVGAANQIVTFNGGTQFNNGSNAYNPSIGFLGRLNLGYNTNKYNGFEIGGTYNFNTEFNYPSGGSMTLNAKTLDASYLFSLPTYVDSLLVFGRVGVAYDWISGSNNGGISGNPGADSVADVLGAGIKYNVTSKTSLRFEWLANGLLFPVVINNGSTNTASWTNQTFMVGLNLHF